MCVNNISFFSQYIFNFTSCLSLEKIAKIHEYIFYLCLSNYLDHDSFHNNTKVALLFMVDCPIHIEDT